MFELFLSRWNLTADGAPVVTHSSRLLPVRRGATPAMLKIAFEAEEKMGGVLMRFWDGDGAARLAPDRARDMNFLYLCLFIRRAGGTM